MADRIETIRKLLTKTPDDVFLHYSLGMELASRKDFDPAVAAFRRCIELDPRYVPAYVEAGKCLRSLGRLDDARDMFTAALAPAAKLPETHTRNFIQQQIDALPRPRGT